MRISDWSSRRVLFRSLVSFGWMWVRMAAAVPALDEATAVEVRKTALARFFVERMLPQTLGLEAALASGASSLMALDAAAFRRSGPDARRPEPTPQHNITDSQSVREGNRVSGSVNLG